MLLQLLCLSILHTGRLALQICAGFHKQVKADSFHVNYLHMLEHAVGAQRGSLIGFWDLRGWQVHAFMVLSGCVIVLDAGCQALQEVSHADTRESPIAPNGHMPGLYLPTAADV